MLTSIAQKVNHLATFSIRGIRRSVVNPREAFLITRMALWVSVLSVLVRFKPLPNALRFVSRSAPPANRVPRFTEQQLARAIDLLLKADIFFFRPSCWKRSAILHRYLMLNGIATTIVFGVRSDPQGQLDGHAWLEAAGEPILEPEPPNYQVTYTFPSSASFDLETAALSRS